MKKHVGEPARRLPDFADRMFGLAAEIGPRKGDVIWNAITAVDNEGDQSEQKGEGLRRSLGMKRSFVPPLGDVVWALPPKVAATTSYSGAIYRLRKDRLIGFIRVPRYVHDRSAVDEFAKIIERLEDTTSALILDQTHNPGGSLFQMYALLAHLTAKPLPVPLHQVKLGEEDVTDAQDILDRAEYGDWLLPEDVPSQELVQWSRFVISHWEKGPGHLSEPVPLFGISHVEPRGRPYTKKIFVLIDELSFSAAEFLAAILKDNQRATLFGVRTAGAGGCVRRFTRNDIIPFEYTLTWTVALRTNGQPIENLGVHPDVACPITVEDIIGGFGEYRRALLAAIEA